MTLALAATEQALVSEDVGDGALVGDVDRRRTPEWRAP